MWWCAMWWYARQHVHEPASLRWTVVMPLCAVELVAGMVAHMAEMPHWSLGHEFGRQIAVLFLQLPFPLKL